MNKKVNYLFGSSFYFIAVVFVFFLIFFSIFTSKIYAADITPPELTLIGYQPVDATVNVPYVDAGATAYDDVDGDITYRIKKFVDGVEVSIVSLDTSILNKTYFITYEVSDLSNNPAPTLTRAVTIKDNIAPIITNNGQSQITIRQGTPYTETDARSDIIAWDNYDGFITPSIAITGLPIDTNVKGAHVLKYNVFDTAVNPAVEIERTIFVFGEIVTAWDTPANTQNYAYDEPVVYYGTWELTPDWVGFIDVFVTPDSGVRTKIKSIPIDSIGESAVISRDFSWTVSPSLASGTYTTSISFDGGSACAFEVPPNCGAENVVLNQSSLPRSFTIGVAPDPILSVTPSTDPAFNFLGAEVGVNTTERDFYVENTGSQTVVGNVVIPIGSRFSCVSGVDCSYSLAEGDPPHKITISFNPIDTVTVYDTLTFTCLACPDVTRNVTGTGTNTPLPPLLGYEMVDTDFGYINIGNNSTLPLTLRNDGGGVLSGTVTFSSLISPLQYTCIGGCDYNVSSGDSLIKTIKFTPLVPGQDDAQLIAGSSFINITGFGNNGPYVAVSPTLTDLGRVNIGEKKDFIINVWNSGLDALSGSVVVPAGDFSCFSGCNYSNLLPGDPWWPVVIRFTPSSPAGSRSATINFTNSRVDITDSASSVANATSNDQPILGFICPTGCPVSYGRHKFDFGILPIGFSSGDQTVVTVINKGLGLLSGTFAPVTDSWEFSCLYGSCSFNSIPPGGTHNVIFSFTALTDTTSSPDDKFDRDFTLNGSDGSREDFWLFGGGVNLGVTLSLRNPTSLHTPSGSQYDTTTIGQTSPELSYHVTQTHPNFRAFVETHPTSAEITISDPIYCRVNCYGFTGGTYNNISPKTNFKPDPASPSGMIESELRFDWYIEAYPSINGTILHPVKGYAIADADLMLEPNQYAGDGNYKTKVVDFGTVNVGDEVYVEVKVYNRGIGTLIGAPDFTGINPDFTCETSFPTPYPVSSGYEPCHYEVTRVVTDGNKYQSILLKFKPTTPLPLGGNYNEFLNFTGGGSGTAQLVAVGNEAPLISISPSGLLDFGDVQTSAFSSKYVTVENIGLGNLTGSITFSPSTNYYCADCNYVNLGPGVSKLMELIFRPTVVGTLPADAYYSNTNNPSDPSLPLQQALTGNGIFSSFITIIGTTNFGNVKLGNHKDHVFNIFNSSDSSIGTGTFNFSNSAFTCIDPSPCEYDLGPHSSAEITVRFEPQTIGLADNDLTLSSYGGVIFYLYGNGLLEIKQEEI